MSKLKVGDKVAVYEAVMCKEGPASDGIRWVGVVKQVFKNTAMVTKPDGFCNKYHRKQINKIIPKKTRSLWLRFCDASKTDPDIKGVYWDKQEAVLASCNDCRIVRYKETKEKLYERDL